MELQSLNYILALGTIVVQIGILALIALYSMRKSFPFCVWVIETVRIWALWKMFVYAFLASALTLYYSEMLGILPCGLCWLERVFLYPQVVILGIAAWRKDVNVALYSMALSACGAFIALYHHIIQIGAGSGLPCPASGGDCAKRIIFEFGYITFPLMAFTLFILMFVVMWIVGKSKSTELYMKL